MGLDVDCEQFLGHGNGVCDTWTINSGYDPGGRASVSYISIFSSVGWPFPYSHPPLYIFHFKNELFLTRIIFFAFILEEPAALLNPAALVISNKQKPKSPRLCLQGVGRVKLGRSLVLRDVVICLSRGLSLLLLALVV